MAQTDTYTNLLLLIEAYMGATLIDIEKTRIKALVNARARSAYRESDLWDPFLVTAEERVVNDSDPTRVFVPFAGTTSADTTVNSIQAGDIDTVLRAHDANPFALNSVKETEVFMGKDGVELPGYKVTYGASQVPVAWASGFGSALMALPLKTDAIVGGTVKVEGVTTASAAANLLVNDTFTLTAVGSQVDAPVDGQSSAIGHAFSTTTSSSDISAAKVSFPVVYLTYKRQLTEVYGPDIPKTTDTITVPMEWRDFIALGVYADMLAADGFHEKSLSWEGKANQALQRELMRIDRNRAHQFVGHRIRTHSSSQARQVSSI